MKKRLGKIAKWVAYPLFYLFCLALCGYLTFPFDALKTRIIAEFDRMQKKGKRRARAGEAPMRLEIDELDSYWFSGVEVTGARLIIPPKKKKKRGKLALGGGKKKDESPPKASVMKIDKVTARVPILPLLIGSVGVNFSAEAFGGEVEGSVPVGADGEVEIEFDNLQLVDVAPLQDMLEGIPLLGVASGSLYLAPKDGKFAKADGTLSLTIDTVKLGKKRKNAETGKMEDVVEMQGVALPSVLLGTIVVEASAKDGLLTIDDFGSKGRDFELAGDGKIKLHESWERANADMYLKFKFSDAYRSKSDAASSLLGKPGDKFKPAIEMAPGSPFKRAKTDDDYYRFHISGPLGKIDFKPAGKKSSRSKGKKSRKPIPPRGGGGMFGKGMRSKLKDLKRPKPAAPRDDKDDKDEKADKEAPPDGAEAPDGATADEKGADGSE